MVCLSSSRSTVGSHEESPCLQRHSPLSHRRSPCAPSHNCHQACLCQAKDEPFPWPWARCSPQPTGSQLCSWLFYNSQGCLDIQESHRRRPRDPLNQLWLSHISDCAFPPQERCLVSSRTAQHLPQWQCGISTVKFPKFYLPKKLCPTAERTQAHNSYVLSNSHKHEGIHET